MRAVTLGLLLIASACSGGSEQGRCDGSACAADECPGGFADCNGDPADGCEADLDTPATCGSCDSVCTAPDNALATCEDGSCSFECRTGFVQCGSECARRCGEEFAEPGTFTFDVFADCASLEVIAWGAGGGDGHQNQKGAAGGFASGTVSVTPGERLLVLVGSPGESTAGEDGGSGGAPGGADGGDSNSQGGGGGGGFSGVFRDEGEATQAGALVMAGGGGGSGGGSVDQAGAGGGLEGQSGNAAGGTQTDGFAPLAGGAGGSQNAGDGGGGGGGGYFGGLGGDGRNSDAESGGGGSGFVIESAAGAVLEAGEGRIPARADDPVRGSAGDPGEPGKVIVDCRP